MRRASIVVGTILVLAAIFNVALPNKAYACLCDPPDNPFEAATAVFSGKVIRITEGTEVTRASVPVIGFEDVTFEVMTAWKGVLQPEVILRQSYLDCSFRFKEGMSYLVYADSRDGSPLGASIRFCSKTDLLSRTDVEALGPGQNMSQASPPQASPPGDFTAPILAGLALVVFAALAAVMYRHKSRSRAN